MGRPFMAAIVGVLVAGSVIALAQGVNSLVFPLPEGTDIEDLDVMAELLRNMPSGAVVGLLLGYLLGGMAGGATARTLGRSVGPAWAVGIVITLSGFANIAMLPHPLWLAVATTVVHLPAALLGARLAGGR
ncbi:MAG: hypothetical protein AAF211_02600 [Myxococcota bacterium]